MDAWTISSSIHRRAATPCHSRRVVSARRQKKVNRLVNHCEEQTPTTPQIFHAALLFACLGSHTLAHLFINTTSCNAIALNGIRSCG